MPFVPDASRTAAAEAAWPKQNVDLSGRHVLHRVVDREERRDVAAGRVDVDVDVLLLVLGLEEQHLGADQVRDVSSIGVPMKMMRSRSSRENRS